MNIAAQEAEELKVNFIGLIDEVGFKLRRTSGGLKYCLNLSNHKRNGQYRGRKKIIQDVITALEKARFQGIEREKVARGEDKLFAYTAKEDKVIITLRSKKDLKTGSYYLVLEIG